MISKKEPEPNIVKDFKIGNTRIQIADNYCRDKTPDEVKAILKHIAENAQAHFNAMAAKQQADKT